MNKIAKFTHKIFYDNKVLMVFSFILAIIIWLVVAIALSPIDTAVIEDVPVTIDLTNSVPAQFDLEIFGQSDFTVDIEISGKRYIVNSPSIDENSFKVIAQTAYVDSAGKKTLDLKVVKANENDEFDIVSVSEDKIEVYFDVYKERDFAIEPRVITKGNLVKNGYIAGDVILSSDRVTVSGPATEVDAIAKVYAELSVDRPLDNTTTQLADLKAYNKNDGLVHYLTFNAGNSDITVTQPVYYQAEKPTSVSFKNVPAAYLENSFSFTVTPSVLNAGIQDVDRNSVPESISIATIDFAQLKPGKNTIKISADDVPSIYIIDDVKEFTVEINVTGCSQKTMFVPEAKISYVNIPDGYDIGELAKSIGSVTVVGPAASLEKLVATDISAVVDLSNIDITASNQTVTAIVSINNSVDCWVSGEYTVELK